MEDLEPLKNRIKELGRQAASFSRQGVELTLNGDRHGGRTLMRQAYGASKLCQALIRELKRQEQEHGIL
ncbi:hypothetical protein F7734_49275 [Scytonema sp. UIC 10036]|uniref:hypothetical protein n=1 Tax=Scytonema sp. UIC 10036 TaxID=2304196 RepID=UPI0012DA8456|nr:hypothetical protein [Scytonema sp. UIC 10036]MUG99848.1 hypothetical protein [Scytonema sp. UIC 10036]